jgi:hypothetical protein
MQRHTAGTSFGILRRKVFPESKQLSISTKKGFLPSTTSHYSKNIMRTSLYITKMKDSEKEQKCKIKVGLTIITKFLENVVGFKYLATGATNPNYFTKNLRTD